MKIAKSILALIIISCGIPANIYSGEANDIGVPVKFIQGCEADFNGDGITDLVFLYERSSGVELVVILSDKREYNSIILYKGHDSNLRLTCQYCTKIQETVAGQGDRQGKIHTIDGNIIKLSQPESSSSVFHWEDGKFKQIWIGD